MASIATTQADVRADNERRLLEHVRANPHTTQGEIARGIGVTRAAVGKLLGPEPTRGKPPTRLRRVLKTEGKRPKRFSLRGELSCVMAVDVGSRHVRVRVTDLAGDEKAGFESVGAVGVARTPTAVLDETARLMNDALAEAGYAPERLAGIAFGVPFPVDGKGVIITSTEWRRVQLPTSMWERLSWSTPNTVIECDATLGAIAEFEAAMRAPELALERETAVMAYVKWSSVITAALVAHGEVHRGNRGMAGSFVHTPVEPLTNAADLEPCACGRICLNSVASVNAIVQNVRRARQAADVHVEGDDELHGMSAEERARYLVTSAREGDEVVAGILDHAAVALGRALGPVLNIVNPGLVIIGGAFHAREFSYLSPAIYRGVEETAYPPALDDVAGHIQSGRRTGAAAVDGGIERALQKFAVTRLLERAR